MKKGIFGGMFDVNRDGKIDSTERMLELMALQEMANEQQRKKSKKKEKILGGILVRKKR